MKVYVHNQGIILTGKAWEIRAKLKQMQHSFDTLEQWVQAVHPCTSHPTLTASATAEKKIGSSSNVRPIV
ncbi:Z-ring formation inhibitor MciZ [Alkalihalobacillus sp. MEB130]|uniref:Z-ring formation inhibitor MciZ n=1 Tax=Alkalihalobacillus sp. MEB130 TaxID=2976704 RepID=UPI0028E63FB7|nr:Z-ring formation inhibitor MciZ [Alkalihalobacillus sp. MEB130]